jgi:hypothetical protein
MNRAIHMIRNSVAAVALAAAIAPTVAQASSFGGFFHLHPQPAVPDNRISFSLYNEAVTAREVTVDGRTYTVERHHLLKIKAPVGTRVYAASREVSHARGAVLVEVTPAMENRQIVVD